MHIGRWRGRNLCPGRVLADALGIYAMMMTDADGWTDLRSDRDGESLV